MNAKEARDMTKKSVTEDVTGLLEHVFKQIRNAAAKGETSVSNPINGLRTPISRPQAKALFQRLQELGYKVDEVCDDRPCGDYYTTVSW